MSQYKLCTKNEHKAGHEKFEIQGSVLPLLGQSCASVLNKCLITLNNENFHFH